MAGVGFIAVRYFPETAPPGDKSSTRRCVSGRGGVQAVIDIEAVHGGVAQEDGGAGGAVEDEAGDRDRGAGGGGDDQAGGPGAVGHHRDLAEGEGELAGGEGELALAAGGIDR